MELRIISPEKTLLREKDVEGVTLPGGGGSFTVLRGHAPILSTLAPGRVVWRSGGTENGFAVAGGIVHAENNVITLYTGQL